MAVEGSVNTKTTSDILDKLNAKNAKVLALVLVIVFSLYHGIRHVKSGVDSCGLALSDGRYNGKYQWHPSGCMLHVFSYTDARRCLKLLQFLGHRNVIKFVGDSHMRHQYLAFVQSLKENAVLEKDIFSDNRLGLQVEYISARNLPSLFNVSAWAARKPPPSLVVMGFGAESLAKSFDRGQFRYNMTLVLTALDELVEMGTEVLWALAEPVQPDQIMTANNTIIDLANQDAVEILRMSNVRLFAAYRKLSVPFQHEMEAGGTLQWDHIARRSGAQILLNVYCNDHMNFNDGSCCSSSESTTTLQLLTLAALVLCLILVSAAIVHVWLTRLRKRSSLSSQTDVPPVLVALGKLAIVMLYFYVCDRTNLFMKESKYYSRYTFWIPVVYIFCVGLFFTEDSRSSKVLHRDQTDEWKGWMQLVILIYNWTDSIQVLPLYMAIRVLASSYLFLSGYGHFTYFWLTENASVSRFFQVLFRLNFLAVILCLVMNRPYQFYSYIPVVSFWFLVIFLWLAIPPRITAASSESHPIQYLYLVLKFVGLFGIITTFYMSEVFFEKIFVTRPWKALFVTTDDDIHQWWYRWKLDRYSLSSGMVFAAGFVLAQRFNLLDDNNHSNLFSNGVALSATLAAFIGLGSYTTFAFLCRDREECDEIHAYAASVPVVSYIVLRNISGVLRTRVSSFFAWFGRISLELYVGQAHVWLAADSHGVLTLLPDYPNLNAAITSFIFICISHENHRFRKIQEKLKNVCFPSFVFIVKKLTLISLALLPQVHEITKILLPHAVPSDWLSIARNLLLFFAVLIPIGVHDGMF